MKDIYASITERFIEQLKNGTIPWQKPWSGAQNIVSQKQYRGINALILGSTDYGSPYWMTFKQCSDLGGRITKGEKSLPVVYYKFFDKRDANGNIVYQDNGQPAQTAFIRKRPAKHRLTGGREISWKGQRRYDSDLSNLKQPFLRWQSDGF